MKPPIFPVCAASPAVTALLGADPRLYPAGEAPEGVAYPYATWQTVGGRPENYLGDLPDIDQFSVQINVWAKTRAQAEAVAKAIRDAVEPHAYITAWRGESRDPVTMSYRYSFEIDWHVQR